MNNFKQQMKLWKSTRVCGITIANDLMQFSDDDNEYRDIYSYVNQGIISPEAYWQIMDMLPLLDITSHMTNAEKGMYLYFCIRANWDYIPNKGARDWRYYYE